MENQDGMTVAELYEKTELIEPSEVLTRVLYAALDFASCVSSFSREETTSARMVEELANLKLWLELLTRGTGQDEFIDLVKLEKLALLVQGVK